MTHDDAVAEAVPLLQDIGLKEYEARCFVALTRLSKGTAREISDISEVPRTRVYDAVEVLEAQGLVEVQHSNPKQHRAVSIEEATRILRQKNNARINTLETHLQGLDPPADDPEDMQQQEVWSLTGHKIIQTRSEDTIAEADSEIVLLVIEEALLTDALLQRVRSATDRGVTVIVGGATDTISTRVETELPAAQVFDTDLNWLLGPNTDDEVAVSRLLLVDRETLLVSTFYPHREDTRNEQAIFATGLGNGLVVLLRRLMVTGLLPVQDAGR